MMYSEFLKISGQEITFEQYSEVIEPMYNAVEQMTKFQFIDFMMPTIKAMAKENAAKKKAEEIKNQRLVFIGDGSKTPNGCYYFGMYGKLVDEDVSIRTGKITAKVRELTEEEEKELYKTHELYLNTLLDYETEWGKKDGEAYDRYNCRYGVILKWVKG